MKQFFGGPGGPLLILLGLGLAGTLFFSSFLGGRGWGYPGYGGFFRPPLPMFSYWGGPSVYGGRYGGFLGNRGGSAYENFNVGGRSPGLAAVRSQPLNTKSSSFSPSVRRDSISNRSSINGGFGFGK